METRKSGIAVDLGQVVRQLSAVETTAREFARNFRKLRRVAARGEIVRVQAPDGIFLFMREESRKTCGSVLEELKAFTGRGFLTDEGAAGIEAAHRRPAKAVSPWDSDP